MKSAETASKTKAETDLLFGELLVSKGLLSSRELTEALNEQREHGGRLGEVLLRLKMLNDEDVTLALAEYLSLEYTRLDDVDKIDMNLAEYCLRVSPNDFAL